jgi:predicted ArsR family transcriptional regulator
MPKTIWSPRFFGTTRGRILKCLCMEPRTVDELAKRLGVTGNAVRVHLASLVRDGLVRPAGTRRAIRKPKVAYDLTLHGQQLFPKAYGALLTRLLDVLSEQLRPDAARALLEQAGSRLVPADLKGRSPAAKRRLARLAEILEPVAELERDGHKFVLRGCGCPLAAVVSEHPEVCQLAADLLTDVLGVPVQEKCNRAESPHCRFEGELPGRSER